MVGLVALIAVAAALFRPRSPSLPATTPSSDMYAAGTTAAESAVVEMFFSHAVAEAEDLRFAHRSPLPRVWVISDRGRPIDPEMEKRLVDEAYQAGRRRGGVTGEATWTVTLDELQWPTPDRARAVGYFQQSPQGRKYEVTRECARVPGAGWAAVEPNPFEVGRPLPGGKRGFLDGP